MRLAAGCQVAICVDALWFVFIYLFIFFAVHLPKNESKI